MESRSAGSGSGAAEATRAERLHGLARRCRELAKLATVPEVARELEGIAQALEVEAGAGDRD